MEEQTLLIPHGGHTLSEELMGVGEGEGEGRRTGIDR